MDIQRIMRIMDASSGTRRIIERSLHEIDRRALNAMVLVKRHGNKLASYGVVAQAFREQAGHLKNAAAPLQQSVAPLVRVQMRVLQHARFTEVFRRTGELVNANRRSSAFLSQAEGNWRRNTEAEEAEGHAQHPGQGARTSLRHSLPRCTGPLP